MPRVIAGTTALVTGGARGIGRATTAALLQEGVQVAIADLDLELAERTAAELAAIGPGVVAYELDVRDLDAFVDVVERVEREMAPLDILVNNAGIMPTGAFLDTDPIVDDRQIDINIRGVLHGMRAVVPRMRDRGRGHVVNISSSAGVAGIPYISVYCGTKHAVRGITEAVRHEVEEVDFSYVMPAFVNTELISGARRLRYPPPIEPTDVANAVVDCLRTGKVDVFVPRFARLATVLPILLPRRAVEAMGRWFGVDRAFAEVDDQARKAYRERIRPVSG